MPKDAEMGMRGAGPAWGRKSIFCLRRAQRTHVQPGRLRSIILADSSRVRERQQVVLVHDIVDVVRRHHLDS